MFDQLMYILIILLNTCYLSSIEGIRRTFGKIQIKSPQSEEFKFIFLSNDKNIQISLHANFNYVS